MEGQITVLGHYQAAPSPATNSHGGKTLVSKSPLQLGISSGNCKSSNAERIVSSLMSRSIIRVFGWLADIVGRKRMYGVELMISESHVLRRFMYHPNARPYSDHRHIRPSSMRKFRFRQLHWFGGSNQRIRTWRAWSSTKLSLCLSSSYGGLSPGSVWVGTTHYPQ